MNKNYNTSDYLSQLNKSKDNQKLSNCKAIKVKSRYKKPAAVKELEDAYLAYQKLKHPTIPDKVFAKKQFRDDTANGLTKCIITFIKFNGGQAERINTTGRLIKSNLRCLGEKDHRMAYMSSKWIPGTSTRGSADISATINGMSVKIEVKIGKDRQSEDQKRYQEAIEKAGGLYFIAGDFPSFKVWYSIQLMLIEQRNRPFNTCECKRDHGITLGSLVNPWLKRNKTEISEGGVRYEEK
mgnify:FL=1